MLCAPWEVKGAKTMSWYHPILCGGKFKLGKGGKTIAAILLY